MNSFVKAVVRKTHILRSFAAICLSIGVLLPHSGWAYEAVDWLYSVDVPVEAQSAEERERVASTGLLRVLTRVTGLRSVPRNEQIVEALAKPDRYYSEFVFFDQTDDEGLDQLYLRIVFQREAILGLISRAQLPVWWNRRPEILVWVVVDDGTGRRILGDDSTEPLVEALRSVSRDRGVHLTLPLMDLDDAMTISAGEVWGRARNAIQRASGRYSPDVVLTGRVRRAATGDLLLYDGDWQVAQIDLNFTARVEKASDSEAAEAALNGVVDRLVERFAVLPRGEQIQTLAVSGIAGAEGYAEMLSYLESLEFVQDLAITGVQDNTLSVEIVTHAGMEQLMELLASEGRFDTDALDMRALKWRG